MASFLNVRNGPFFRVASAFRRKIGSASKNRRPQAACPPRRFPVVRFGHDTGRTSNVSRHFADARLRPRPVATGFRGASTRSDERRTNPVIHSRSRSARRCRAPRRRSGFAEAPPAQWCFATGRRASRPEPVRPAARSRGRRIATDVLAQAIEDRGWRVVRFVGSAESVHDLLRDRRPVIVLLGEARGRFHYVVVVGTTGPHRRSRSVTRAVASAECAGLCRSMAAGRVLGAAGAASAS